MCNTILRNRKIFYAMVTKKQHKLYSCIVYITILLRLLLCSTDSSGREWLNEKLQKDFVGQRKKCVHYCTVKYIFVKTEFLWKNCNPLKGKNTKSKNNFFSKIENDLRYICRNQKVFNFISQL